MFSPSHGDKEELKALYLSEDEEKKIRKDFIRKTEKPKILIVTEKLLTGFDAPILYCMYLDKPMRDHVLLRANEVCPIHKSVSCCGRSILPSPGF